MEAGGALAAGWAAGSEGAAGWAGAAAAEGVEGAAGAGAGAAGVVPSTEGMLPYNMMSTPKRAPLITIKEWRRLLTLMRYSTARSGLLKLALKARIT